MRFSTILYAVEGAVATIRLHRPQRMNAVIETMYREIREVVEEVRRDPELRCLVITGSELERDGVRKQAFCAGADLKEHAGGGRSAAERRAYIRLAHDTTRSLWELPKPVLAVINGPARGAGAELALSCDVVLMAHEASLAFPELGLGTFVGGGVTHILPRLVGLARAKELILSGRVIDGGEAWRIGLAAQCVPLAELEQTAAQLARRLAAQAPISMALAKRFLHRSPGRDLEAVLDLETEAILGLMDTEDWREGVVAFSERRKPVYRGC